MFTTRSTSPRRALSRALIVTTLTLATTVMATAGAAAAPTPTTDPARGVGQVTSTGS